MTELEQKMEILFSNLITMVFCLGLGLFATYFKIITPTSVPHFSGFIFYFSLPLFLFCEIVNAHIDDHLEVLKVLGIMISANFIMYAFTALGSALYYRSFKSGAILGLCTTYSSSIFISLPLVKSLDEQNGGTTNYSLYCTLAFFLWDITLVPISVFIFELRQKKRRRRSSWLIRISIGLFRSLLNPITLPVIFGIIFYTIKYFTKWTLPTVLLDAMLKVGKLSSILSLFVMGMGIHGKVLLGNSLFDTLILILLKQIAMPFIVFILLYLSGVTDRDLLTSLYLTNSTPPAQVVFLLSVQYGNIALLQVSSCLVLGLFLSIPILFMSVSFLQLNLSDLIYLVDISVGNFPYIINRTAQIMCFCTLICGILTLLPFILNPTYRVRLRRFVTMLCLSQMGTSFFFGIGTVISTESRVMCNIQGFGIQFFCAMSMLWFFFTSMQMSFKFVFGWGGGIIRELSLHIVALIISIVTAIVPIFLPEGWNYSMGGAPWCWIGSTYLQFALFYLPYFIFSILGLANVIIIQITERKRKKRFKALDLPESYIKAKANLLWKCRIFIIIFAIIWAFGFTNRFLQLILQKTSTFFILVWLHIAFSCGQGVPTFIIFGTGSQIMNDYKLFFSKVAKQVMYLSNITKILSGRNSAFGIASGKTNIDDDHKEEGEEDEIEFATGFLFSPSTLKKLSAMAKQVDIETDSKLDLGMQNSFSINLLDNDYEKGRSGTIIRKRAIDSSEDEMDIDFEMSELKNVDTENSLDDNN